VLNRDEASQVVASTWDASSLFRHIKTQQLAKKLASGGYFNGVYFCFLLLSKLHPTDYCKPCGAIGILTAQSSKTLSFNNEERLISISATLSEIYLHDWVHF
jgi:hypothetical protein